VATTVPAPPLFAHLGDPWRVAEMLQTPGTVCTGHFRLLSGQHSDQFVRFSELARRPEVLGHIVELLAANVAPLAPKGVIAPCTAGVALGAEIARRLSVRLCLASVGEDGRADGFIDEPPAGGTPMLAVNDIVTTGDGLRALASVVGQADATVVGAAAFLCRSEPSAISGLDLPLALVATTPLAAWEPADCRLCAEHEPVADGRDLN